MSLYYKVFNTFALTAGISIGYYLTDRFYFSKEEEEKTKTIHISHMTKTDISKEMAEISRLSGTNK